MPLNKVQLKEKIRLLSDTLYDNPDELNPEEAREKYATDLSNAIDEYVRTGLVSVSVNVTTSGTATAQTGGGNGTGNIT